ncbi:MAG: glycosyltransferase family 39 protein [bacterium]|nr:glycosyltransferase family 39 protein [bacterium]
MSKKQTLIILISILTASSFLRLWELSRGDMLNDEVTYSLRAVGLLDYFNEPTQTTPLQWFDSNAPWWTKISFHDHPPLVFLIQNLFINVFGENPIAFRLPSVILGVLSVYLAYLISSRLFSKNSGLIAAALLAVTVNHIYISRTGMQEAYVIFFMLLSVFLFLLSLERDKYFIYFGLALGLAFLTKYTTFILVPVFAVYLLFAKPTVFLNKKLWLGFALTLILFTPVIVYNFELYRAVGHFDFQFSYLLREHPKEWPSMPGRTEVGTLGQRIRDFVPHLIESNSWLFLSLFTTSFLAFLALLFRCPKETLKKFGFLATMFFYLAALLLLIGPTYRFLTMLAPFMAISTGVFIWWLYQKFFVGKTLPAAVLFALILCFEVFYSYNNQIAYYPKGATPWLSSKIRYENYNLGYKELGEYLDKELTGKMPGIVFDPNYSFLATVQERAISQAKKESLQPYPALIVYYDNFDIGPRLWIFDRLLIYHGWPIMNFGEYMKIVAENAPAYFAKSGVKHFYFISRTNIVPSPEFLSATRSTAPINIYNKKGDEAFHIYKM